MLTIKEAAVNISVKQTNRLYSITLHQAFLDLKLK